MVLLTTRLTVTILSLAPPSIGSRSRAIDILIPEPVRLVSRSRLWRRLRRAGIERRDHPRRRRADGMLLRLLVNLRIRELMGAALKRKESQWAAST